MKNTFSTNIIFVLLILIGASLLPLLSVQMAPSQSSNNLNISYEWKGALPEVVEKEVTSKLEGLAATLKNVRRISSKSSKGKGSISINFHKHTNLKLAKFELNSLIRSSYKKLPENVSLPVVREGRARGAQEETPPILYYTIIGNGSSHYIQQFGEDFFHTQLSAIPGVENITFYGETPYEWELAYNKEKLEKAQLTTNDIKTAIYRYTDKRELGFGLEKDHRGNHNQTYIEFKGHEGNDESIDWNNIPVKKINNRIVYLGDLVTTHFKPQEAKRYSRINGLNTTRMIISAEEHVNQIKLVKNVKKEIEKLEQQLPKGFSLILDRDTTEDLVQEIKTISFRIISSVILILLLVLIISRKWRYLFIIVASLLANISIAFILYYFLNIEIHPYSLAGITVSFGILVDNSILMLDHLRHKKNKKVFLAILAATLTTIGALSVIAFLEDKIKNNLVDFAMVIIVNLSTSLLVAFFFIPSLLDKFPLRSIRFKLFYKRKQRIHRFSNIYFRFINFERRFKKTVLFIAILGFGIPVFWIPTHLKGDAIYIGWYNTIFESETYETIKPFTDKVLGGSIRLFTEVKFGQNREEDKGRTRLNLYIYMPDGAVIKQTNDIAKKIENFLSQFPEVESYITYIYSIENAGIQILFKPEHDDSGFPHFLSEELISVASNIGGCDVSVRGVGSGFSNRLNDTRRSSGLEIKGYNYETILIYAEQAKERLLEIPRVQKAIINTGRKRYRDKPRSEYVMSLNAELLAKTNSSTKQMLRNLKRITFDNQKISNTIINGEYIPVNLISSSSKKADIWAVSNEMIARGKLKDIGQLTKKPSIGSIDKQNQEFKVSLEYDFIGSYGLGEEILNRTVDSLNTKLPIGFEAKAKSKRPWNPKNKSQYWLIFLVIIIIYFICAILLESLVQPLAIIMMIPLSFTGVFLTFSMFKFKFDQGGYAAFLLLCGLIVNASLYIINDYNSIKKEHTNAIKSYIKAYNTKIIPIFLTILSTILGLIPFLFSKKPEPFWFALSAGTIGGLIFSIPILIMYLPLFMFWKKDLLKTTTISSKKNSAQNNYND